VINVCVVGANLLQILKVSKYIFGRVVNSLKGLKVYGFKSLRV